MPRPQCRTPPTLDGLVGEEAGSGQLGDEASPGVVVQADAGPADAAASVLGTYLSSLLMAAAVAAAMAVQGARTSLSRQSSFSSSLGGLSQEFERLDSLTSSPARSGRPSAAPSPLPSPLRPGGRSPPPDRRRADSADSGGVAGLLVSVLGQVAASACEWRQFMPTFAALFEEHGSLLLHPSNARPLKEMAFQLMRMMISANEDLRKHSVVALLLMCRTTFQCLGRLQHMKVLLTMTLSELMSDSRLLDLASAGRVVETGDVERLRMSLDQLFSKSASAALLRDCGLAQGSLEAFDVSGRSRWDWQEVEDLSKSLQNVLGAFIEHSRQGLLGKRDPHALVESYAALAHAYAHVPDLHIMWLLHLCSAHQESQSWAEAALCSIAVASVISRALASRKDTVWDRRRLERLWHADPLRAFHDRAAVEPDYMVGSMSEYGASKLTGDAAMKYIQMAHQFLSKANLYAFCPDLLHLLIAVYHSRENYMQLSKCYSSMAAVYKHLAEQASEPHYFKDASYYRVGFYGESFGKLNGREYVYRERRETRLGDIVERFQKVYEKLHHKSRRGEHAVELISDSNQVDPKVLKSGRLYLQITSVESLPDQHRTTSKGIPKGIPRLTQFCFETPFTKSSKSQMQGSLKDQWKRQTILEVDGAFPSLFNRLPIVKSSVKEFTPIQNAVAMVELEAEATAGQEYAPRLQALQRILQGSVAVMVNGGMLGVCVAFLKPLSGGKVRAKSQDTTMDEITMLTSAIVKFVRVCELAIQVHAQVMGPDKEDQAFHNELVLGFVDLTERISHFIPASVVMT
eukprot:SM000326S12434  [mRNA]  locus=s326:106260:112275:- [translate_table: standard]